MFVRAYEATVCDDRTRLMDKGFTKLSALTLSVSVNVSMETTRAEKEGKERRTGELMRTFRALGRGRLHFAGLSRSPSAASDNIGIIVGFRVRPRPCGSGKKRDEHSDDSVRGALK